MFLISVFRISHHYLFEKIEKKAPRLNYIAFFASVFTTSLTWGVGFAYFMIQPEELSAKIIMLASTVGLNSGGVVAFIPSWRTSALYNVFMLLPAAVTMFYHGIHLTLVVLIILFIIYMAVIALRGNREYWDALENEHLLQAQNQRNRENQPGGCINRFV